MDYEVIKNLLAVATVGIMAFVVWIAWQQRKVRDASLQHIRINSNIEEKKW